MLTMVARLLSPWRVGAAVDTYVSATYSKCISVGKFDNSVIEPALHCKPYECYNQEV